MTNPNPRRDTSNSSFYMGASVRYIKDRKEQHFTGSGHAAAIINQELAAKRRGR